MKWHPTKIGMRKTIPLSMALLWVGVSLSACGGGGSTTTAKGGSGTTSSSASSSSSSNTSGGGKIVVDVFGALTGHDAALTNTYTLPGARAGVLAINDQGGVLGKKIVLTKTDSKADPADAVPAAKQVVATNPPVMVVGPTTPTALSVVPIFNKAKIVMFSPAGNPQLDHLKYKYLYRPLPPDAVQGVGMAIPVIQKGYKRAAIMFGNNTGVQTILPALLKTLKNHGVRVVFNDSLNLDQPSYRSDVSKMLATHPDVILTATDAQTAATFFSELKQAAGGLNIPVFGSQDIDSASYIDAVKKAVGLSDLEKVLYAVPYSSTRSNNQATAAYKKYFLKANNNNATNLNMGINSIIYDEFNIMALAMTEAHSTVPSKYVSYIRKITTDPSAVHVHTYTQGLKEIKAGKQIFWDGAGGTYPFNSYGYMVTSLTLDHLTAQGFTPISTITEKEVNQYFPH